jgi:hypothetical protein
LPSCLRAYLPLAGQDRPAAGIYLGCGPAEADGEECFNSYVIAGPDAPIIGTARKTDAESFAFDVESAYM